MDYTLQNFDEVEQWEINETKLSIDDIRQNAHANM